MARALAFVAVVGHQLFFAASSRAGSLAPTCEPLFKQYGHAGVASTVLLLKRPILTGYHLPENFLTGYYERRILPYLQKTKYPEVKDPEFLYRGMYITVEELANIVQRGFEIDFVRWTAVGGKGVYFATGAQEASRYIFHNGTSAKTGIGVVFKVRRTAAMELVNDPQNNPTNTIYISRQSVGPGAIVDVSVWGQWGLENLAEVLSKASAGRVVPHESWTGAFDGQFSR